MKKILFIQVHSGIGGATTSLYQLIHKLNSSFIIEVLITGGNGPLVEKIEKLGIKVRVENGLLSYGHGNGARTPFWSFPPFKPITDLLKLPKSIIKYRKIISESNCDIVYLNTSILWPAAISAKKENKKVITHVREIWYDGLLGFRKHFFIKLTEKYSDKIIVLSKRSKEQFYRKEIVNVIYNSVDFEKFEKINISKNEAKKELDLNTNHKIVLMMGGALPHKGPINFVRAAKIIKKEWSNITFAILGHTNPFFDQKPQGIKSFIKKILISDPGKKLQDTITKLNLVNDFLLPGPVENVAIWLRASDVLVFPATVDHFGRPLIEAGFMELPVVASDLPTSRELIINGKNGFLFKNLDYEDLANKISELISNENLAKEFGVEGRKLSIEKYSLDFQIKKISEILTGL